MGSEMCIRDRHLPLVRFHLYKDALHATATVVVVRPYRFRGSFSPREAKALKNPALETDVEKELTLIKI